MAGFKSKAHRSRLEKLVAEGKFPQSEFDDLRRQSADDLPDRANSRPNASRPSSRLSTGGTDRYTRAAKARLY